MQFIRGTEGSHTNFLSYALNILLCDKELVEIRQDQCFHDIKYPEGIERHYFPHGKTNLLSLLIDTDHTIRIIVDDELLWIHQFLCRYGGNMNIIDFEKNPFMTHGGDKDLMIFNVRQVFGRYFQTAKKQWQKGKQQEILEFIYKKRIFGQMIPYRYSIKVYEDPPEGIYLFPFSAFYNFEEFNKNICKILSNSNQTKCKLLHDQFMSNVIHTPENIHQNGSILYKCWQEYIG